MVLGHGRSLALLPVEAQNLCQRGNSVISRLVETISPRRARRARFQSLVDSGRAQIGKYSYAVPNIRVYDHDTTSLSIGNFSSIGAGVTLILGGNHRLDRATTFPLRQKLD